MSIPPKHAARTSRAHGGVSEVAGAAQSFPVHALSAQLRAAELIAEMNGTLLQTARDIWTSQNEWFRHEVTHAAEMPKNLAATDGQAAMAATLVSWQEHGGRLATHMRQMADRLQECQRQILSLQQKAMADAMRPAGKDTGKAA